MEDLLNIHGKCFGKFWACETCTEVGWSPQFNNKYEMEIHISKIHMNAKPNKINLDDRICTIINTIKSCDDWFNSLIDIDFDDSLERTKFFIGSEDKIGNLNDTNFKSLIKQIENFYFESGSFDSIVNYNYNIDIIPDILTGDFVGFITESEVYQEYNFNMHKNQSEKNEDSSFEQIYKHCEINEDMNEITFIENENHLKNIDNNMENDEIYQDIKLYELEPNSVKNEEHENHEYENDNIQCNICGKILKEDLGFQLHVEYMHKDYFLDEDNQLLLREDLISKEIIASKCKLCLENFKMNDLNEHVKSFHPTEFEENKNYSENIIKKDKSDTFLENTINDLNLLKTDLEKDIQLKNEDYFCDVTLACEDKQFQTHKLILNTFTNYIDRNEYELFIEIECDDSLILLENESQVEMSKDEHYDGINGFEKSYSLQEEILIVEHMSKKIELSCDDCDKVANEQKVVNNHLGIKQVQVIQSYKFKDFIESSKMCDECDNIFGRTHNLYKHKINVHKEIQHTCDICGYNLKQKDQLEMHMKIHVNIKVLNQAFNIVKSEFKNEIKKRNTLLKLIKEWKKRRKK